MAGYGTLEAVLSYPDITDYVPKPGAPAATEHEVEEGARDSSCQRVRPAARWGRGQILASSAAFLLVLCAVLVVHRPVRRDAGSANLHAGRMRLSAKALDGSSESPSRFVRAYNTDYGEVKGPTVQLYNMEMVLEPHRETILEVMGATEGSTFSWEVATITRGTGELVYLLQEDETSDSSVTVTCTEPGEWHKVTVTESRIDGKPRPAMPTSTSPYS